MNDQEREMERLFRAVHWHHKRIMEHHLERTGLSRSQHMTLIYLSNHAGCSQKDIAIAHNISTAAATMNLQRLEKEGMLKRCVDSADNRRNVLSITDKGRAVVEQSHKIFEAVDSLMLVGLSKEERKQFQTVLEKMMQNLISVEEDGEMVERYIAKHSSPKKEK